MNKRYFACALALAVAAWPLARLAASPRCYPSSRFVVLAGGLVRDTLTQLVWQRDGSGTRTGCSGGTLTCTWAEANSYCSSLGSGFRVPTVRELNSLVDLTVTSGATINQTAFPGTPTDPPFWTSSPFAGLSGYAWFVYFGDGSSGGKVVGSSYRVRCVR